MTAILIAITIIWLALLSVCVAILATESRRLRCAQDTQHLTLMDHGQRLASVERQVERDAGRECRAPAPTKPPPGRKYGGMP